MSAASPEFYRPSAAPSFSPQPCGAFSLAGDVEEYSTYSSSCRTPTGSGISYLREPTTCPPAPRKAPPPPCKKRLFHQQDGEPEPVLLSLRLDELERIFRPHQPLQQQQQGDKRVRHRPATRQQQRKQEISSTAKAEA